MKTPCHFGLCIVTMLVISLSAIGQQGFDDSEMRRNAASRIAKSHQINVDWRTTSLLEIMDIEARLNAAARIKRNHGLSFDWRNTTLVELTGTEARLNAVARIERNHGVRFDWKTSTLRQLTDAEARMNAANRLAKSTGKPVDWRQYTLLQLNEMELRASGVDVEALKKAAAAQASANAAVAPVTAGSVVESKIDGDFEGWEGETIVKLMNGQIWQQTEYHYHYHYAFMPDVLIYKKGTQWKMKVEGVEKSVGVERLK